ncbi:MAG: hypothetical protein NC222_06140 [Staphylococcus sp.]|nr:hypothetical protein [Staphylococcus sp.]
MSTNINKNNIIEMVKNTSIIFSIIGGIFFFLYKMQGLPPRVSKLEQDLQVTKEQLKSEINELKSQIDKNNTKTDIILDDVKVIKSLLMGGR